MSSLAKPAFPEIRIRYGWLLSQNASSHINKLLGDGRPLHDYDYYDRIAQDYKKAWAPHESTILEAQYNLTGLSYRQNIIDVYVAPWFFAFSDPLTLGVRFDDDELLIHLTHELAHRLLTDNIQTPYDTDYLKMWAKLFGGRHDFVTLVHIPVHALVEAIYTDVLKKPDMINKDIEWVKDNAGYRKSWEYVKKHGYKEILQKLRVAYEAHEGVK